VALFYAFVKNQNFCASRWVSVLYVPLCWTRSFSSTYGAVAIDLGLPGFLIHQSRPSCTPLLHQLGILPRHTGRIAMAPNTSIARAGSTLESDLTAEI